MRRLGRAICDAGCRRPAGPAAPLTCQSLALSGLDLGEEEKEAHHPEGVRCHPGGIEGARSARLLTECRYRAQHNLGVGLSRAEGASPRWLRRPTVRPSSRVGRTRLGVHNGTASRRPPLGADNRTAAAIPAAYPDSRRAAPLPRPAADRASPWPVDSPISRVTQEESCLVSWLEGTGRAAR